MQNNEEYVSLLLANNEITETYIKYMQILPQNLWKIEIKICSYLIIFQNLSLNSFLTFVQFEARCSYKSCSYKKKSV